MKIVVIGGSGLIGSKLVKRLTTKGHAVIAASPSAGINTITGEGLAEALAGAQVVIDVANSPSFEDNAVMEFFRVSGQNLLAAEAKAGVQHHVALSVVGTQRLQESGYFRAKQVQEELIQASGIPYTLVHSTQFFEFAGGIAQSGTKADGIHLSTALIQPISSEDVATAVADIATGAPQNKTVEIAGPETFQLDELVHAYLQHNRDTRKVIADGGARYFGALLQERTLLPEQDAYTGTDRFSDWLNGSPIKN
jgi:uncharacterized protein YbjT (DUF2867 family)